MPIYSKENTFTVSGLSCKIHMVANLGSGDIPSNVILLVAEYIGDVKSFFVQMAAQKLLRDMKTFYISLLHVPAKISKKGCI